MKSKVLSLILAITLLCGIMVPTAAFAEVDKGPEILIANAATALQNPGSFNDVAAGNISFANYANRQTSYTDNKGPIIQVSNTSESGIGGANGGFAHFPITHNLTLTNSFTFEFEYFAKNNVNVALALGDMDVFVHFGGSGRVAFTNGSALGYSEQLTLNTDTWNKVAFTFDGAKYSVYANDELVGSFDALKTDITGTETMKIGVFSGSKKVSNNAIVAVDKIYAYPSAYVPEVSDDPVDPSEPEEDEEVTEATYIAVTTNNFKYDTGAEYGTSAEMRAMKDKDNVNNSVPVIKLPKDQKVGKSGGKYPRFEITHGLTTNKSFTFMFDYFAHDIWTGFSFGTDDIFAVKNAGGANTPVYYHNGSGFQPVESTTINADEWHTVVFSYSKTTGKYSLYVDDTCIATFNRTIADPTTIRIGTFLNSAPVEDDGGYIAVDNVYVYQDDYNPDIILKEPEVEKDVITITASSANRTVTASATFSDTYATGDHWLWLALYDTGDNNNELIGVTCVNIDSAEYKEAKITFDTEEAFSAVDYAQAFVWDDNYTPTGVKALVGSKPQ